MATVSIYGVTWDASTGTAIQDVVNDSYVDVLKKLLPTGAAWQLESGGNFENLLRALSHAFVRIEKRGLDLLNEFDPQTMFELIADWERVLGLPGSNPSPPSTTATRRSDIWARLLGNADPTASAMEAIATAQGYTDAEVSQHDYPVFVAGSSCGASINNTDWMYLWEMVTQRGDDDALLEWSLGRVTPLHTILKMFWLSGPLVSKTVGTQNLFVTKFKDTNSDPKWVVAGLVTDLSTADGYAPPTDTSDWTSRFGQGLVYPRGLAHCPNKSPSNGGQFILVGNSNGIKTSQGDLSTWTARTSAGAYVGDFTGVTDGSGTNVVIVGTEGNGLRGEIQYSTDGGDTWNNASITVAPDGSPDDFQGVAYNGTVYCAIEEKTVWVTSDPTSWSTYYDLPISTGTVVAIAANRGGAGSNASFVVITEDSILRGNEDGTSWNEATPTWSGVTFVDVTYAGDKWLVCASNGEVYESRFGEVWRVFDHTSGTLYGIGTHYPYTNPSGDNYVVCSRQNGSVILGRT